MSGGRVAPTKRRRSARGWMCLLHSGPMNIEDLLPEDIDLRDIAGALALINRFTGQSRKAIPVIWHCRMVRELCRDHSRAVQLEALLHDAEEAYIGDWIQPLKHRFGSDLIEIKDQVHRACFDAAGNHAGNDTDGRRQERRRADVAVRARIPVRARPSGAVARPDDGHGRGASQSGTEGGRRAAAERGRESGAGPAVRRRRVRVAGALGDARQVERGAGSRGGVEAEAKKDTMMPNEGTKTKRIQLGDFSRHPGPRYRAQGPASGEELREGWLVPELTKAAASGGTLIVDLGGTEYGLPIGFLEEAFGGLVRRMGAETVKRHLEIDNDEHEDANEIERVMREAANQRPEKNPLDGEEDRVLLGAVRAYALMARVLGQDSEDVAEGQALYNALEEAAARFPSWNWPLISTWSLVRGRALKDHAVVAAVALGCEPSSWPGCHVDWDAAAEELGHGLATVTWKGTTWWVAPTEPGAQAKPIRSAPPRKKS